MDETYDVVVIGGGAAGLSGALTLARARRTVLVIDAGSPRNAPAGHVHNYLGREGTPPGELLAIARAEVTGYGGTVMPGRVVALRRADDEFVVDVADGEPVRARRLLLATGLTDELPDLPGLAQRWGSEVLHCPYCHGWEVRDRAIGILSTGSLGAYAALLWRQWSEDVVLFQHTGAEPTDEELEQLAARGIRVVRGEVAALEGGAAVRLASGEVVERDAVVVAPRFTANADLLAGLGATPVPQEMHGSVMGTYLPADPTGRTDVPGVWVAGNAGDLSAQVVVAAAQGLRAGAMINADLITEDTRRAVAERAQRAGVRAVDRESYDQLYRSASEVWSGRPNRQLVAEAGDLRPGTALDAGCGEGADALWLAERGWRVTAVDFSPVALDRGAARAGQRGLDDRIEWLHADLDVWTPPVRRFDLVTAHYLHARGADRAALFERLAAAVAPGGTLLVVGHLLDQGAGPDHQQAPDHQHAADHQHAHEHQHAHDPDLLYTAEDVAAVLDPGQWRDVVTETRGRDPEAVARTGNPAPDTVLVARRRSGAR